MGARLKKGAALRFTMTLTGLERYILFTRSVEDAYKIIQKIKADHMSRLGFRSTDTTLIFMLGIHEDGLTATELAAKCNVDKAVISRAVKALCESGAVKYASDGKKNYRSRLCLGEKGKELFASLAPIAAEATLAANNGIPTEELKIFYKTLDSLNRNLQEYAKGIES